MLEEKRTEKIVELNGRKFILIGTAHVSQESIADVERAIENQKPETVAIELDEKRYESLKDPESWKKMDVIKVLKNKMGFLMLANIVLSAYQKRMGNKAEVKPGDEMLAAIRKCDELNIKKVMVDRPIAVTLRRAWAKNSLWGKCKLLSALLATAFVKEDDMSPEEIENLKKSSEMDSMMGELSSYLPTVKEVLIDERDRYLASHIWECEGDVVLAVLGAGHLPGVEAYLNRLAKKEVQSNCDDISEVPKKTLASKIGSWVIPVLIVALIVAGFVFGGRKEGISMLSSWVLWNGVLSALFACFAAAHPLVVILSFIGAPITSLCPFVGIGLFTGILQALLCKPKISDMETLQDDALSLKGFYKNKILRVFLVFFLSSLGSSIGTFAAGASFVAPVTRFFDEIVIFIKNLF